MQNILRLVLLTLLSTQSMALELNAELSPGNDSNPFTLADKFDPQSAVFIDTKLKVRKAFENIRLTAQINNRSYEGLDGNGDSATSKLEARYKTRYLISEKKTTSYFTLDYANKDKTYISHSTGLPGTFSSQSIKDRYDYSLLGAEAKTIIYLDKKRKTDIRINIQNRDYEDYNLSGLSNFDYQQIDLSNGWSIKKDKKNTFDFDLKLSLRAYDDKRERTLIGDTIAGSDLEYRSYVFSASHEYLLSKSYLSRIKLNLGKRSDSGSGYYDTSDFKLTALLRYSINEKIQLDSSLTYQDYEYDNNVTIDPDDEGNPNKQGYTLRLKLDKEIVISKTPAEFFAGFRYDDYDSNDSNYIYDRLQIFAGLKIKFNT